MRNLRIIMLLLMAVVMIPAAAQTEDELIEEDSLKELADTMDVVTVDSLSADSLLADSIRSLPWPENVRYHLDRLLESSMFETSQVGMMVWDLDADSCIYRYRERQLLRPASCMKLVTAITAIDKLGGSYQFKTQLKFTGERKDSILEGDIYVIGGMDPRFNSDDMASFVMSLKEMGIDSIAGHIYADLSMKDSNPYGEGWCWDDDNYVLTPLLFQRKDIFMPRFLEKLYNEGIHPTDSAFEVKRCPSDARLLTVRSHSLDQVLYRMMKESDNLYAESMFYQIAASTGNRPASSKSARNVEKKLVNKVGLNASSYKYADGSGLSLYNYVSAELLVRLLRYSFINDNIYMHLRQSLPIAGVDGTLKKRMKGTPAYDNVRAKTGTVTGCYSLSGYCNAGNGHRLCFSILNQGVMHAKNARNFQDKVCNVLCTDYSKLMDAENDDKESK